MSLETVVHVKCDVRTCRARYHYTPADLTAETAKAQAKGWFRVGTVDWCPFHATEHHR